MDDPLWIVSLGDCYIEVKLDKIQDLPNANFRRILKIARSNPEKNAAGLEQLREYLEIAVETSKKDWIEAGRTFSNEWRYVENKRSRDPKTVEILKRNKELKQACARARSLNTRLMSLLNIFNEEKEKNK